jgi:hypothetical protein
MNNRQRKTLAAIISNSMPKTMVGADIEALLLAIGWSIGNPSFVIFPFSQ